MAYLQKALRDHSFNNVEKWIERVEKELDEDNVEKLKISCQIVADDCSYHYMDNDGRASWVCTELYPAIEKLALKAKSPQAAKLLLGLIIIHQESIPWGSLSHRLNPDLIDFFLNLANTNENEELLNQICNLMKDMKYDTWFPNLLAKYRWPRKRNIAFCERYHDYILAVASQKNERALLDILDARIHSADTELLRCISSDFDTPAIRAHFSCNMTSDFKDAHLWSSSDLKLIYFLLKIGANKYVEDIESPQKRRTIIHRVVKLNPQPNELQQIMILPSFDINSWPPSNLEASKKRIVTLLCCIKQKAREWQLPALYTPDAVNLIIARCCAGFTGKKMATTMLNYLSENDLPEIVTHYPNDWLKGAPLKYRSKILDLLTNQRITYLKMLCATEDADGKVPSDYAPNPSLKNLLIPANQDELLSAQVRDQIAQELEYN